jgi:mRNA interferase MazF
MVAPTIRQGDIYWVGVGPPVASEPAYRHPHVVVQSDVYNRSQLRTVIVCALTSNLRRAEVPGNVLLAAGEANLPRASVVSVTQVFTVDRSELVESIGRLSRRRVREIVEGIQLVLAPATESEDR